MIYLQLFWSFLQIGLFSFGGGYAAMPLIQNQVVAVHGWLTQREFTDLVTISQMTPGPIAINSATFVGSKIAGTGGSLAATIGCILPSCIIVSLLAYMYMKYRKLDMMQGILNTLRPAVVSMIATAGMAILITAFFGEEVVVKLSAMRWDAIIIFILAVAALRLKKWNPILVMVLAGVLELVWKAVGGH